MNSHLEVIFPIFSDNVFGKSFTVAGQNPGVGGTQFVSIILTLLLARRFPEMQVRIVNHAEVLLPDSPANVKVEIAADFNEFLQSLERISKKFLIILPQALVRSAERQSIEKFREQIIAWVHHPFQYDPLLRKMRLAGHVHVGSYQYFSNAPFYRNNWEINNPFVLPNSTYRKVRPDLGSKIRVVYLGALIKAKGFGDIARQWASIKEILPSVELHVIGSSATYGNSPEHAVVPCDSGLAEEILNHIPMEDIKKERVIFHGNLGQEKFEIMRSAHFAILNPTGASEAFPASPLECMACGLPVIASDDYGMSDSMRFFPELILRSPEKIPDRIQFLMSDRFRYEELSARSIAVAAWFDSQTDVILTRWRRLFDLAAEGPVSALGDFPPLWPLYGSRFKLKIRQIRARLGVIIQPLSRILKISGLRR